MDLTILLGVAILIVALVVLAAWLTMRRRRTDHLRDRFGDEYDRTLDDSGGRSRAEAALEEREKRVAKLEIRPLTDEERGQYAREWVEVKSVFVDSPPEALLHADRMLANMMKAKGFPMADFDHLYEDLTVEHGDVARHYRAGHQIAERNAAGSATTEEMRQAMKHYEALYDHLVSDGTNPEAQASGRKAFDLASNGDGDRQVQRQDLDGDEDSDRVVVRSAR